MSGLKRMMPYTPAPALISLDAYLGGSVEKGGEGGEGWLGGRLIFGSGGGTRDGLGGSGDSDRGSGFGGGGDGRTGDGDGGSKLGGGPGSGVVMTAAAEGGDF